MTPDERKQLGINKSTLWYIKKNMNYKKGTRIYNKVTSKLELNYNLILRVRFITIM